jgi:hypothetical protein
MLDLIAPTVGAVLKRTFDRFSAPCAAKGDVGTMSWPAIRSDSDVLCAFAIGVGLCWSVALSSTNSANRQKPDLPITK